MNDSFTSSQPGKSGGNTSNSPQHQEKNYTYQLMEAPERSPQQAGAIGLNHLNPGNHLDSSNYFQQNPLNVNPFAALWPQGNQAPPVQAKQEASPKKSVPTQKKENNTGLPDHLKSGIENLSGYAMDDVKVHYNSDKPAQLQAHAYAQGTEIHIGAGQEQHVPHEAWHVVQQKQGRVQPTRQMKGNVPVNDDKGLEREADVMGAKAMQLTGNLNNKDRGNASVISKSEPTLQKQSFFQSSIDPPKKDPSFEVPWNDTEMDQYTQLSGYGKKSNGKSLKDVEYIVLHSTGGNSTLSKIDAHFEVATDGTIYLANPLDKGADHAAHDTQRQKEHQRYQYKDINRRSQGIEFVNPPTTLKNQPSSISDTKKINAMRAEIKGLGLAPRFKKSLIGLSDEDLFNRMDNSDFVLYEDIEPAQKQAAYEMYRNIQQDYPDAEFIAHEHVSPKKVGEGESIQEFLETITEYNAKLTQLQAMAPEFWSHEDPKKGTLQNQAERAMSRTQFFAQFYSINAQADDSLAFFYNSISMPSNDLMLQIDKEQEEEVGMHNILSKFKRYIAYKTLLSRNFSVKVKVIHSQDCWGGEDIYIKVNGTISSIVEIDSGKYHTFTFPNTEIKDSLQWWKKRTTKIEIKESDDLSPDDLLMRISWNPHKNPKGITKENTNYKVTVSF